MAFIELMLILIYFLIVSDVREKNKYEKRKKKVKNKIFRTSNVSPSYENETKLSTYAMDHTKTK